VSAPSVGELETATLLQAEMLALPLVGPYPTGSR
jgi:hypothetical protein